jgi:kynurenine formamidase
VREGRVFCLSLPLDFPGGRVLAPHRFPPELAPTERHGERYRDYSFSNEGTYCDVGCDDSVRLCTQYSTQWDALSHIGQRFDADGDGVAEACYYNGLSAAELGIEHMAATGLQGRGVLVDLEAAFGRARRVVGYAELMTAMEAGGATVEPGDILCLHTGFADVVLGMERRPDARALREACAVLDGTDERLLEWIGDSGIAAIAADNYAVEGLPPRERPGVHPFVPLHAHCLFKLGIPLGELWYLTELAAWLKSRRRTRFLLTAPPLRLPGAAGSPVTPVATV